MKNSPTNYTDPSGLQELPSWLVQPETASDSELAWELNRSATDTRLHRPAAERSGASQGELLSSVLGLPRDILAWIGEGYAAQRDRAQSIVVNSDSSLERNLAKVDMYVSSFMASIFETQSGYAGVVDVPTVVENVGQRYEYYDAQGLSVYEATVLTFHPGVGMAEWWDGTSYQAGDFGQKLSTFEGRYRGAMSFLNTATTVLGGVGTARNLLGVSQIGTMTVGDGFRVAGRGLVRTGFETGVLTPTSIKLPYMPRMRVGMSLMDDAPRGGPLRASAQVNSDGPIAMRVQLEQVKSQMEWSPHPPMGGNPFPNRTATVAAQWELENYVDLMVGVKGTARRFPELISSSPRKTFPTSYRPGQPTGR